MNVFGLDPESVAARLRTSPTPPAVPTLAQSLWAGGIGFSFVSVVVFAIWAYAGKRLSQALGEPGFFAVCGLAFIGLAGLELRQLVIGPGATVRFCGLFAAGFGAYAVVWCLAWFLVGGKVGEWLGSLGGTAALAVVWTGAFSAAKQLVPVGTVLFVAHSIGYFAGEILYASFRGKPGMLLWGAAYGLGFGLGIGYALFVCQAPIRSKLDGVRN